MIVVTTPTGQIGSQVLTSLLSSHEDLRVVVRDPARLDPAARDRVEVVTGSHDDPDVARRALAGADAVLWIVPPNLQTDDVMAYYDRFSQAAVAGLRAHQVPRLVGVSTLGLGWPGWEDRAGNLSAGLVADEALAATGTATRTLAMGYYNENLLAQAPAIAKGVLALPNAGERVLRTTAVRDVAAKAAELLLDRPWTGHERVSVVGPDQLTPPQMAQVVAQTLGRPVAFRQVAGEDFAAMLSGFGATSRAVNSMVAMVSAQDHGIYEAELGDDHPGTAPTSFRQWCQEVLSPAVSATSR